MPIVAMPDGANVQFPDDMPPEQIKGLIAQKFPQTASQSSVASPQSDPSFLGTMGNQFTQGVSDAGDFATMNYKSGDAQLPAQANLRAKHQAGTAGLEDYAAALMEGGANSPPGKALSAIMGIVPEFNVAGAAVNKYVNPAIQDVTGAGPATVQSAEMLLPFLGKALPKRVPSDEMGNPLPPEPPNGGINIPSLNLLASPVKRLMQPTETLPPDLTNNLFNGSPDSAAFIGEDLGNALKSKATEAKQAVEKAYATAEPAGDVTVVPKNNALGLADAIEGSLKEGNFDPKSGTAYSRITDSVQELRDLSENASGIKYNTLETMRKRFNAIPYTAENAGPKAAAIKAFDTHLDSLLENGLIEGDQSAISLIKDARSKNAYYKQTFDSKNANRVVRSYIKSKGNSLTPENLADTFSRVGQIGYDNASAAKDILGDQATPLLKQAYLTKLRTSSTVNGELNAAKLGQNVLKFIDEPKNQSLVKLIFTPKEMMQLRTAANRGISSKTEPNLLGKAIVGGVKRTPIIGGIGDVVEGLLSTARNTRTLKKMQRAE